jgi:histone deacetylase 1/2
MKVFGSTAYVHTPKQFRNKLDPVNRPGVFLGYEPNSKAYRILVDNKIVVSSSVRFDETRTPPLQALDEAMTQLDLGDMQPQPAPPPAAPQPAPAAPAVPPAIQDADMHAPRRAREGDIPDLPVPRQVPVPGIYSTRSGRPVIRPKVYEANIGHALVAEEDEPLTFEEAIATGDPRWKQAMNEEMASLHSNGTWTLEPLPPGVKPLPPKWVFKIKRDSNGNIERHKARLVVKGFLQVEGIDFSEVYAPVSKHSTLRALLSVTAIHGLQLRQLDVKTAFLNGDLQEDIYMVQPPGYEEGGPEIVCKLHSSVRPEAGTTCLASETEDSPGATRLLCQQRRPQPLHQD